MTELTSEEARALMEHTQAAKMLWDHWVDRCGSHAAAIATLDAVLANESPDADPDETAILVAVRRVGADVISH